MLKDLEKLLILYLNTLRVELWNTVYCITSKIHSIFLQHELNNNSFNGNVAQRRHTARRFLYLSCNDCALTAYRFWILSNDTPPRTLIPAYIPLVYCQLFVRYEGR